jgi:hypothetical protein
VAFFVFFFVSTRPALALLLHENIDNATGRLASLFPFCVGFLVDKIFVTDLFISFVS